MRSVIVVAAVVLCVLSAGFASAEMIGTYVDATPGGNTLPGSVFSTFADRSDTDGLWTPYAGLGFGRSDSWVAQQSDWENAPMLTMTVTGLEDGLYNVYMVYMTSTAVTANWNVQAALSGQPLVTYTKTDGFATGQTWQDGATVERQVLIGTAAVTGGSFAVDIDGYNNPVQGWDNRTWWDGVAYESVPEPGTIVLLASGLIGLLCYAWRRRK